MEEAVVGDPVDDVEHPLDILRTVRSFDPCLACAVHVRSPDAEYETVIEPARPEMEATNHCETGEPPVIDND